jgi:hypothetical protein
MNTLAALPGNACFVGPEVSPWIEWRDRSNDPINYGGEDGTRMALGHARVVLEMMEKWECQNWEECWRAWPWKWSVGYNYE